MPVVNDRQAVAAATASGMMNQWATMAARIMDVPPRRAKPTRSAAFNARRQLHCAELDESRG